MLTDKTRCILFTVAPPTSNEIVHLNVGGHMYTTLKSTLCKFPSLALVEILKNCDEDGNVFIDRDVRMFYYILGFLRTGELSLPDDFSDFDSLTHEVNYFDIDELKFYLKVAKNKKLLFNYIEILETKINGSVKTVLKSRKEDLGRLPLGTFQIECGFEPQNVKDSSYVEIILNGRHARLQLAEVLIRSKWTRESSDFSSSSHYQPNNPDCVTIEHCYRDRWKKINLTEL